jgi:undecaprenyl-diphosphatase
MDFDFIRATILAVVQGLTEFLPISSSAHLILPSELLGWQDQGLNFDMALHLGSLAAVLLYFRRDLRELVGALLRQAIYRQHSQESALAWKLLLATLPVTFSGLLFEDVVETELRNVDVIIMTTLLYGLLLLVAEKTATGRLGLGQLGWRASLCIGLAQALAIVPGTSRSGVTMTAALFAGLRREEAARFSFLLSIPTIGGAALLRLLDLLELPDVDWGELGYAMVVSALTAYGCIHWFLRLIGRVGFLPFVVYRLLLGAVLLYVVHGA